MASYLSFFYLLLALFCASVATIANGQPRPRPRDGICTLVESHPGYICEEHQVTTKDGYILGIQRMSSKKTSTNSASGDKKTPVIIQHGLTASASCWLLLSPDKALPFILADEGYDVWLSNSRGTAPSQGHRYRSYFGLPYWDWSWYELSAYDLPAYFDYVKSETGQKSHYVGHSLGTLIVLAALSNHTLPDSIRSAALLAPIAHISHIGRRVVADQTKYEEQLQKSHFLQGVAENLQDNKRSSSPLGRGKWGVRLGEALKDPFGTIKSPSCCISPPVYASLVPQPTSLKNQDHLFQMAVTGAVQMYNYGAGNIPIYRQLTPPRFDMASIPKDFPLYLAYGGRDTLSVDTDVKILINDLRDHDEDKLVTNFLPMYGHLDFIMANNAKENVYDPLLSFINKN